MIIAEGLTMPATVTTTGCTPNVALVGITNNRRADTGFVGNLDVQLAGRSIVERHRDAVHGRRNPGQRCQQGKAVRHLRGRRQLRAWNDVPLLRPLMAIPVVAPAKKITVTSMTCGTALVD